MTKPQSQDTSFQTHFAHPKESNNNMLLVTLEIYHSLLLFQPYLIKPLLWNSSFSLHNYKSHLMSSLLWNREELV